MVSLPHRIKNSVIDINFVASIIRKIQYIRDNIMRFFGRSGAAIRIWKLQLLGVGHLIIATC